MPINVVCPCGQKLSAKDSLAGKTVKCPKCGKPLRIGSGDSSATSVGAKRGPAQGHNRPTHDPIGDLLDEVGITVSRTGRRCPDCGSDMTKEAVICIECGYHTETGRRLKTRRDIIDPS